MKYKITLLIFTLIAIILYSLVETKDVKHNEKYYQTKFCNELGGIMEYRLSDKTRVDCLTDRYAIEVDFARKWAEGIGQSLYYAEITSKEPAIALIIASNEERYLKRLKKVTDKFSIKIFIIEK